jgi:hypothetical protein
MRRALYQMGRAAEPIFPHDYTPVANVIAKSLDQVWEIIKDKGDVGGGADNWQCWEKHPAVDVLATITRSTSPADVVIEPDGKPHYAGANGFDYGSGGNGNDFHMLDALCVMSMARDKYRKIKPNLWQRIRKASARAVWVLRECYSD